MDTKKGDVVTPRMVSGYEDVDEMLDATNKFLGYAKTADGALLRKSYIVQETNEASKKIQIKLDNGELRWYPVSDFTKLNTTKTRILLMLIALLAGVLFLYFLQNILLSI